MAATLGFNLSSEAEARTPQPQPACLLTLILLYIIKAMNSTVENQINAF